jgi:hypothetical protein
LVLSGAERSPDRAAMLAVNPGYALCLLESDADGALGDAMDLALLRLRGTRWPKLVGAAPG